VWAPAPFQSPRIGLGSRVANTPKSSAIRNSSHRATHSWSPIAGGAGRRSGTPTGPSSPRRWCPRCRARPSCRPRCGARRCRDRASCRRPRRSSTGPGEPGSRSGQPSGRPVLEERVLLLDAEHRLLVGVLLGRRHAGGPGVGGMGVKSVSCTSHMHELVVGAPQRVGTDEHGLQDAVGVVPQGLVGARAVEAPDAGLLPSATIRVLLAQQRRLGPVDPDVLGLIAELALLGYPPEDLLVEGRASSTTRSPRSRSSPRRRRTCVGSWAPSWPRTRARRARGPLRRDGTPRSLGHPPQRHAEAGERRGLVGSRPGARGRSPSAASQLRGLRRAALVLAGDRARPSSSTSREPASASRCARTSGTPESVPAPSLAAAVRGLIVVLNASPYSR
jgi:hypothetical protein